MLKIDWEQRKCPHGLMGSYALYKMRGKHKKIVEYASSLFKINSTDKIIDIGCGHGYNIKKMLGVASLVYGVDISPLAVKKSKGANRRAIRAGRARILEGDIKDIKLDGLKFNIATAYCTVGFWEDKLSSFRAIYSLLMDNGIFIIAGHNRLDYSLIEGLLYEAGFSEVKCINNGELLAIRATK